MNLEGVWLNYNSGNTPLPEGMIVGQLAAGPSGLVWVNVIENIVSHRSRLITGAAKTHGILEFMAGNWVYRPLAETTIRNSNITGMTCDRAGNLWLSLAPNCLARFDGLSWRLFLPGESGLPSDFGLTSTLIADLQGDIWAIMIPVGVFRLDSSSETWHKFQDPNLTDGWVTSATLDSNGQVWFVLQDDLSTRLFVYSGRTLEEQERLDVGFGQEQVRALVVDKHRGLWLAWHDWGGESRLGLWLLRQSSRRWEKFTINNSPLPDRHIQSLTLDKHNRLWAGTTSGFAIFGADDPVAWSKIMPGVKHGPLTLKDDSDLNNAVRDSAITIISDYATVDSTARLWARSYRGVSVFTEAE